jgi:hypothetical protein
MYIDVLESEERPPRRTGAPNSEHMRVVDDEQIRRNYLNSTPTRQVGSGLCGPSRSTRHTGPARRNGPVFHLAFGSQRNRDKDPDLQKATTTSSIGQVHRYLDVLQEVAGHGLRDHPEILAYHPRAVIVIGRSNTWNSDQLKALHGLNSRLSGVSLMTYDQLLSMGDRLLEIMNISESPATAEDTA